MTTTQAKDIVEELSKKYFRKEILEATGGAEPLFWNIFTYRSFTNEDLRMLGYALVHLGNLK